MWYFARTYSYIKKIPIFYSNLNRKLKDDEITFHCFYLWDCPTRIWVSRTYCTWNLLLPIYDLYFVVRKPVRLPCCVNREAFDEVWIYWKEKLRQLLNYFNQDLKSVWPRGSFSIVITELNVLWIELVGFDAVIKNT